MNDKDFYQDWFDDDEEPETEGEEERPSGKARTAFHVLYQDDDLLALDKAPGVPTIPERGSEESLKTLAQQQFGRLWTVHRIDKQTSGVVLFARTAEAHRDLNEQFRTRETEKRSRVACTSSPLTTSASPSSSWMTAARWRVQPTTTSSDTLTV